MTLFKRDFLPDTIFKNANYDSRQQLKTEFSHSEIYVYIYATTTNNEEKKK